MLNQNEYSELKNSLEGIMRLLNKETSFISGSEEEKILSNKNEEYCKGITDVLILLEPFLATLNIEIDADLLGYFVKYNMKPRFSNLV